jgi:hypothetical protein
MMEAARTSETLVNVYQTTRCYNPEDSRLHTHLRENLKSYIMVFVVLDKSNSVCLFHVLFCGTRFLLHISLVFLRKQSRKINKAESTFYVKEIFHLSYYAVTSSLCFTEISTWDLSETFSCAEYMKQLSFMPACEIITYSLSTFYVRD